MPGRTEDLGASASGDGAPLGAGTVTVPPPGVGQPRLDSFAPPEASSDGEGGRMTLAEHLAELRRRLLICIGAVVVTAVVGWFAYKPVLDFMEHSYVAFCHKHPGKLLSCSLLARTPTEGFLTRLKLAGYLGIALAAPVWLWELWRFITPGLKKNEKRYAVPFLLSALTLFAMGVAVAVLVWPKALNWLISVAGPGVQQAYSIGPYVSLYTLICLVFGLVFLYPIVVVFLMIAGVVPTKTWRKWRRVAIVVLCSVAAIVTPSNDPFTFLAMAVPMIILYEASIILGRALGK
jgi:sec-independent protein translocase protein TatC